MTDADKRNREGIGSLDRPSKTRLSTIIADQMAGMIQKGVLKPGTHLVQNEWADRFDVSRVAIRDALAQLTQSGLVEHVPEKGNVVRSITAREIRDIFGARRCVEAEAVRIACERINDTQLAQLDSMLRIQENSLNEGDVEAFLDTDVQFHLTMYRLCGNDVLFEIIERLWFRARQARNLVRLCPDKAEVETLIRQSLERHLRIVEALRNGECGRCVAEVINSMDQSEIELVEIVESYQNEESP